MSDVPHEMEVACPPAGGLLRATMRLQWADAGPFSAVPTAEAVGWRGPYKLQQWWERVGAPGGEWRDVEVGAPCSGGGPGAPVPP